MKSRSLKVRLIRGIHVLFILVLVGVTVGVYFNARDNYQMASRQNSYITCPDNPNTKISLSKLGVTGNYTVSSKTLNGVKTGDDLLAYKACYPSNETTCPSLTGEGYTTCLPPLHGYYNVHFVRNDTMSPTKEAGIVFGIGFVAIEIVLVIISYVTLGKLYP